MFNHIVDYQLEYHWYCGTNFLAKICKKVFLEGSLINKAYIYVELLIFLVYYVRNLLRIDFSLKFSWWCLKQYVGNSSIYNFITLKSYIQYFNFYICSIHIYCKKLQSKKIHFRAFFTQYSQQKVALNNKCKEVSQGFFKILTRAYEKLLLKF